MREERRAEFHSGTREGRILGDDAYAEHVLAQSDRQLRRGYTLAEAIDAVCRACGISAKQLNAPGKLRPYAEARALAAVLVQESPDITVTELGKAVHREIAPLARAARRLVEKAAGDMRLMSLIEKTRNALMESQ